MVCKCITATTYGINAYLVEAEIDVINSLPNISIVGLPDNAVSEAKERIRSAIKNSGYNSVLLWVFEKNTRARSFYEKHGFELTDNTQISYDAVEVMYRKDLCRD